MIGDNEKVEENDADFLLDFQLYHSLPGMSSSLSIYVNFPGSSARYTHEAAIKSASKVFASSRWEIIDGKGEMPTSDENLAPSNHSIYFCDYDLLPFDYLAPSPSSSSSTYPLCSSYIIRKALIRKHYLSHSIHSFKVKQSAQLQNRIEGIIPKTWRIELQFADELDELLVDDLWDLDVEMSRNKEILERRSLDQDQTVIGKGKAREISEEIKWFIVSSLVLKKEHESLSWKVGVFDEWRSRFRRMSDSDSPSNLADLLFC